MNWLMRNFVLAAVTFLATAGIASATGPTSCYSRVYKPPGTVGTCGPCDQPYYVGDCFCLGTPTVQTITTGYWICVTAAPGAAGNTACTGTWIVVGTVGPCEIGPNTAQIMSCMSTAEDCLVLCEACLVPGAGWVACIPCAGCLAFLGYDCTGCSIRSCTVNAAAAVPLSKYTKTFAGVDCTGS